MPKVMPEYKEEVRKKIVRAALEIGGEKGLSDIRMEDVAVRVGISRATLYLYFRNREELIAEGNKAFCEDVSKMFSEAFEKECCNDVFLAMFDNFLFPGGSSGNNIAVEMFAASVKDEQIRDILYDTYYSMRSIISEFISEQEKKGTIPKEVDPDLAAKIIQAVALGIKMGSIVGLESEEARKIWQASIERVLSY
ncbi:transcriptional regulator, TetR family [Methanolacinia petrolearia DSM 11571]|uniref:Transcriptional regulator, TetR family n=2 Tax=Methanolacinia TaxID=230355 RepID=E1RIY5_METP4|nr:transcriptional regulator, TetR family [Methanolacinia petrolearia DSM 11571]